jgi:hypothetical protein
MEVPLGMNPEEPATPIGNSHTVDEAGLDVGFGLEFLLQPGDSQALSACAGRQCRGRSTCSIGA